MAICRKKFPEFVYFPEKTDKNRVKSCESVKKTTLLKKIKKTLAILIGLCYDNKRDILFMYFEEVQKNG